MKENNPDKVPLIDSNADLRKWITYTSFDKGSYYNGKINSMANETLSDGVMLRNGHHTLSSSDSSR